jgi:VanZ family protein
MMMSSRARRWFLAGFVAQLIVVITIVVLAYGGALPLPRLAIANWDLLAHAVLIGMLGMFLDGALGFRPLWRTAPRFLGLGPIIIIGVAGVEEILQMYASHRSSTLSDFVADVVGVVLFSAAARILTRVSGLRKDDPSPPA